MLVIWILREILVEVSDGNKNMFLESVRYSLYYKVVKNMTDLC